jgi:hypothetical protein
MIALLSGMSMLLASVFVCSFLQLIVNIPQLELSNSFNRLGPRMNSSGTRSDSYWWWHEGAYTRLDFSLTYGTAVSNKEPF